MASASSVDGYLAAQPPAARAVLEDLRRTIRAAAPEATESIAYDMPALRVGGRFLVSYAAFKRHYSLFPASAVVVEALGTELEPYLAGKGTTPLPGRRAGPARSREARRRGAPGRGRRERGAVSAGRA